MKYLKVLFLKSSSLLLFGLLSISACSQIKYPQKIKIVSFKDVHATEVFLTAYTGIYERYIDQVSMEDIAIEGLRGLGSIDPSLTIILANSEKNQHLIKNNQQRTKGVVILQAGGTEVIRKLAPPPDDVVNWAALTTELSLAARKTSHELQRTTMESYFEAVFDGALSNLDVFSRYSGADEALEIRSKRDGFSGIGIKFKTHGIYPVIKKVLPGTPANLADLQKGDLLTHINGEELKGLKRKEISALLQGPIHSRIELTFIRPTISGSKTIVIERTQIFPNTITQNISKDVVVLKLKSFNQNTAQSLLENLIEARKFLGKAMKGIIIDLRGNPGGLLKQSVKVADLLLTPGSIVSTRGRHTDSLNQYESGKKDFTFGLPLAVLVDGKSASAAEIVAAALQDRNRAIIIGTTSFGKGSVQTVLRLPNEGEITLTWSRLVTPSGYIFHGLGVRPQICTSGLHGDSIDIVKKVISQSKKIKNVLLDWRKTSYEDKLKRAQLRNSCPSQRRLNDFELSIAKQLITNPALYKRALNLSANIKKGD